jgi:hypothetical protein
VPNGPISVSVIAPYLRLMNDGKTPFLGDFAPAIRQALREAATAAYRAIARPPKKMSIKDAAWQVMKEAYLAAGDDGQLPANARQVMYAARPKILALTGADKLGDSYFTQTLLPDYIAANPDQCADWDVVFDARGHFVEPHTGRSIPLGTLAVREYLGDRPQTGPSVTLNADDRYPTSGPENRYRNILFVEKEGFDPLLQQARIAERYDLAIMSTKGMSVTAARMLLDRLSPQIDRVFVLHDFDISGFSIFGTLAADGRRYVYENAVNMVDLGLRLADMRAMGLQSEPVAVSDRAARIATLRHHGATLDEVVFLCGRAIEDGEDGRRVELNAMTSRQFIDFIEQKLGEHGVEKVVPDTSTVTIHARRLIEQNLAEQALDKIRDKITEQASSVRLPDDLKRQLQEELRRYPDLPWDVALSRIVEAIAPEDGEI